METPWKDALRIVNPEGGGAPVAKRKAMPKTVSKTVVSVPDA